MTDSSSQPIQRIAILGLGGYEADPQRTRRACDYFASLGIATVVAPEAGQKHLRFAADDAGRLEALERFSTDPGIDVVMAQRGGYGLTRLLDRIDFPAVARSVAHGTCYVGHSDFTVFHLALLATTGAISYAGPMSSYDFGVDPAERAISAFTAAHFWAMLRDGSDSISFTTSQARPLTVRGTLWGGNLAMVCSLLATPWMPQIDGGILFLEDVNEQPYRVERLLLQLHQAGVLQRQQAVLLGDFSGYRVHDYDNGYDFDSMLAYLRSVIRIPLIDGLPFGHCPDKLTLPVGGTAEVEVAGGFCSLVMSA